MRKQISGVKNRGDGTCREGCGKCREDCGKRRGHDATPRKNAGKRRDKKIYAHIT